MKKFTTIMLFVALTLNVSAQEKGSYISGSFGLGSSGYRYHLKGLSSDGIRHNKLGWNAQIGYTYFFTPHWGLGTGVAASFYRTVGRYPEAFSTNHYYNLGTQTDDDLSGNVQNYELRARLSNWHEEQKGYFIEIPLMAMYQYKFGKAKRHGLYAGLGVKLQIPIASKYKVMDAAYENDLRLNISGYYPNRDLELGGPSDPSVEQHGFGSIYDPNAKLDWNGNLSLKPSIAVSGEFGFLIGLGRRVDLTLGAYIDYGLNNIKKGASDAPLMETTGQYFPSANNNIGSGIQYNGMLNSDRTSRANTASYGGKIGIRIKLGKLSEKTTKAISEDPGKEQPPAAASTVNCCDSMKARTDSLKRQLDEIQNSINQMNTKSDQDQSSLMKVQGTILDAKTRQPLAATIEVSDNNGHQMVTTVISDSASGKYLFYLPYGKNYAVNVHKDHYMNFSENIDNTDSTAPKTMNEVIYLNQIEENQTMVLKNIFFDFDKATLRSESLKEIDNLYNFMMKYPTVVVEISGHTDNVGSAAYNKKLSLERAQAVVQELEKKGIPADRMKSAGYGFDRPIATNETPEGRAENRRTEFKIIKK